METVLPGYFLRCCIRLSSPAGAFDGETMLNRKARRIIIDEVLAAKAFPNGQVASASSAVSKPLNPNGSYRRWRRTGSVHDFAG